MSCERTIARISIQSFSVVSNRVHAPGTETSPKPGSGSQSGQISSFAQQVLPAWLLCVGEATASFTFQPPAMLDNHIVMPLIWLSVGLCGVLSQLFDSKMQEEILFWS